MRWWWDLFCIRPTHWNLFYSAHSMKQQSTGRHVVVLSHDYPDSEPTSQFEPDRGFIWTDIWWEAPMEGSVLRFLKAEWKVCDTGSAQCWASSFCCNWQNLLCLLMDQNEMSNIYRGPSVYASCQVSYHLAKRFQRKSCFRNRPIRNKNYLWRPCLILVSDWLISKKISPLKPLFQMNRNLVGYIVHLWEVLY
jgi:hypothetical protein